MKKFEFITHKKKILADTYTPVGIYLSLRDKYAGTLLLESSDYHSKENSLSYICCHPIASIKLENKILTKHYPNNTSEIETLSANDDLSDKIFEFTNSFQGDTEADGLINNGLFGYCTFDAVQYFEDIEFKTAKNKEKSIPDALYQIFQIVLVIDQFKNEMFCYEHLISEINSLPLQKSILNTIKNRNTNHFDFKKRGEEKSNTCDSDFINLVDKVKEHCYKGDVFQMVLSRRFEQSYLGDDFNVYRALRSINPSPYLFYFDFIDFKIFGSSPEANLVVSDTIAEIHPIAGTYKRTGDDAKDKKSALLLSEDEKENAEHVMLLDLARNDLSKYANNVRVVKDREVQYFSHVIHLVSKVIGEVEDKASKIKLLGSTFPAGTLSGAPKYKALSLIDLYENENRSFYGGAIGIIDFEGRSNQAIIIRSVLAKNNKLFYQAGAGIVAKSNSYEENQEVYNKIKAIQNAIIKAENI